MRSVRMTATVLGLALAAPAWGGDVADLLSQGPIAPCLEDHFDPERYQVDLAAIGWAPLADEAIPQAALLFAVTFLPMTNPVVPGRPDVGRARLDAASVDWAAELRARPALLLGNSLLSLRGSTTDDGARMLECWLVTPDADFVEGLLARAQTEAPIPPDAPVVAMLEPEVLSEVTQLQVIASRNPNPPGPAAGLVTQLLTSPAP